MRNDGTGIKGPESGWPLPVTLTPTIDQRRGRELFDMMDQYVGIRYRCQVPSLPTGQSFFYRLFTIKLLQPPYNKGLDLRSPLYSLVTRTLS